MKKTDKFILLCLAAFVFASCEQKTDVNVQNEENRIFSEEINKCYDTFMHSDLKGDNLQTPKTRYEGACSELSDDLKDVYISFPDSTDKKYYLEAISAKTIEDLMKLHHRTAAEFSMKDSLSHSCSVKVSEKAALESVNPLIAPSKKFLRERGFTESELNDMVKENNATESDLVLLALTVNEQERSNQKLAKEASVNSFNILDLLATPAYAENYQAEATKSIFRDVTECAIVALGADFTGFGFCSTATQWTKATIKRVFINIAKKALGPVGAAISIGTFLWCMYKKGYIF